MCFTRMTLPEAPFTMPKSMFFPQFQTKKMTPPPPPLKKTFFKDRCKSVLPVCVADIGNIGNIGAVNCVSIHFLLKHR